MENTGEQKIDDRQSCLPATFPLFGWPYLQRACAQMDTSPEKSEKADTTIASPGKGDASSRSSTHAGTPANPTGVGAIWLFFAVNLVAVAYVCLPSINGFLNGVIDKVVSLQRDVHISGTPVILVYIGAILCTYIGIATRSGDSRSDVVDSRMTAIAFCIGLAAAYVLCVHKHTWVFWLGAVALPGVGLALIPNRSSLWTNFLALGLVFIFFTLLGHPLVFGYSTNALPEDYVDFLFLARLYFCGVAAVWLLSRAASIATVEFRTIANPRVTDLIESTNPIFRIVTTIADALAYAWVSLPDWWICFWKALRSEVRSLFDPAIWANLWRFCFLLFVVLFVSKNLQSARDDLVAHLRTDYPLESLSLSPRQLLIFVAPLARLVGWVLFGMLVAALCRYLTNTISEARRDIRRRLGNPVSALAIVAFVVGLLFVPIARIDGVEVSGFAGVPISAVLIGVAMFVALIRHFVLRKRKYEATKLA